MGLPSRRIFGFVLQLSALGLALAGCARSDYSFSLRPPGADATAMSPDPQIPSGGGGDVLPGPGSDPDLGVPNSGGNNGGGSGGNGGGSGGSGSDVIGTDGSGTGGSGSDGSGTGGSGTEGGGTGTATGPGAGGTGTDGGSGTGGTGTPGEVVPPPTQVVSEFCLPSVSGIFALNKGSNVKFNGTVNVTGNANIYQGAVMTLTGATTVLGTLFKDSASSIVLKGATAAVAPMPAAELAVRDQVIAAGRAAEKLAPTMPLDPADPSAIDLAKSMSYTAKAGALNVISARNISLSSGQKLELCGDADDVFVLQVSGNASFGDGLVLSGGLQPNHVLVSISARDSMAMVTVGSTSSVAGTFLSLDRQLNFSGQGRFRGALISGSLLAPAINVGGNGGGTAVFEADAFCSRRDAAL